MTQDFDYADLNVGTYGFLPNDRCHTVKLFGSTLDLNLVYRPAFIKGLTAKWDVFNVFNSQKTTAVTERYESAANYNTPGLFLTGAANVNLDTYLLPRALQAPRAYRLMLQYNF